jgi:hypothetical protein
MEAASVIDLVRHTFTYARGIDDQRDERSRL